MKKEKPTNPKDAMGALKLNPLLIPITALVGVMRCMKNGAKKYGPFNWRNEKAKVGTMTYLAAAIRHILSYTDGEENASDSNLNHIDHAISGLLVLRDAQLNGYCVDDRPVKGQFGPLIDELLKLEKESDKSKVRRRRKS